jgi:hypothetical protein
MTSRIIAAVAATAVLATAAFWHFSPYLALHRMNTAAQALDAETFNAHVDYPRLRENLKAEFSAHFARQAAPANNALARAGMEMGSMIGQAMVGGMVDAMVQPDVVMNAMKAGRLDAQEAGVEPRLGGKDAADAEPDWTTDREGVNTFVVYVGEPDDTQEQRVGMVMERSGFASWRLAGVRLPATLGAQRMN